MRKIFTAVSAAAVAAAMMASPAMARPDHYHHNRVVAGEAATGVAVGTLAGIGLYHGWFGSGVTATALGATAGTAAVAGGVAGVGTVALIDAAIQPCRGFHALFGLNKDVCVNGEYVGDHPYRRMR